MKTEIDQAFCNILIGDATAVLNIAYVDDTFMRNPSFTAGLKHRIAVVET